MSAAGGGQLGRAAVLPRALGGAQYRARSAVRAPVRLGHCRRGGGDGLFAVRLGDRPDGLYGAALPLAAAGCAVAAV